MSQSLTGANLTSIEVCSGAGGQAIGLEKAGFKHLACVELDKDACNTIELNRPEWNPQNVDLKEWVWESGESVDLLAGGVPCPPFSLAGAQLGEADDRDLFPSMLRLVKEIRPKVVMIENVRGLLSRRFDEYREFILGTLNSLGYQGEWQLLQAADFGVAQLRPRSVLVAMRPEFWSHFDWPEPVANEWLSVGDVLAKDMASNGWEGAAAWSERARGVAPTLVGGSKKHGGADVGPTRAKEQWRTRFGIDGRGIADQAPERGFEGMPRLTTRMAATLQGFPEDWVFSGKKTSIYRQIGNAFPPPVAGAIGNCIRVALENASSIDSKQILQEVA